MPMVDALNKEWVIGKSSSPLSVERVIVSIIEKSMSRKDITDFTLSYSSKTPSKYTAVRLEPIRMSSAGDSYQWTMSFKLKSNISFLIVTGINQDLETELTYTVQ